MRGYIHVYTGDGKGKTTAALGLALRAMGAGLKVFIGQFVKGMKYSETNILDKLSGRIVVKQYGRNCFIEKDPEEADIKAAQQGLREMKEIMSSGERGLVVMDEINIAVYYGLVGVDQVLEAIKEKHESVELIITGRKAAPQIIEAADLVTEMREIKHYYRRGVEARKGIES